MNKLQAHLIADWHWVLTRSWSVRFIAVAAVLSGLEAIVPLFSDRIAPGVFASLSFLITAAALVSRLVAQKHVSD